MKKDWSFISLVIGLICCCAGYGLWRYLWNDLPPDECSPTGYQNPHAVNYFFIMISLGFTFYTLAPRIALRKIWKEAAIDKERKTFMKYLIADFAFNLAGTKVITEVLLDGAKVHVYEYWNLALCVLIVLIRLIKY